MRSKENLEIVSYLLQRTINHLTSHPMERCVADTCISASGERKIKGIPPQGRRRITLEKIVAIGDEENTRVKGYDPHLPVRSAPRTTAEASPAPLAKRVRSHRPESRGRRRHVIEPREGLFAPQSLPNGRTNNPYNIPLQK